MQLLTTARKIKSFFFTRSVENTMPDLEMILPACMSQSIPDMQLDKTYNIRQYRDSDHDNFFKLIEASDLSGCSLEYWNKQVLPGGFFIIIHEPSGAMVGACMAAHHPQKRHKFAGCLGWLAVHPDHRGKGIGQYLTLQVMKRLFGGHYTRIFLGTQDYRLSAIKTYLKLGWLPYLYQDGMAERWKIICNQLNWPYAPEEWAKKINAPGDTGQ